MAKRRNKSCEIKGAINNVHKEFRKLTQNMYPETKHCAEYEIRTNQKPRRLTYVQYHCRTKEYTPGNTMTPTETARCKGLQQWHPRRGEGIPSHSHASPRWKRREVKPTDTGARVPVVTEPSLILRTDPDDLNSRWCLPESTVGTSVPVAGFASVAVTALHPLDGVRRHLLLLVPTQSAEEVSHFFF